MAMGRAALPDLLLRFDQMVAGRLQFEAAVWAPRDYSLGGFRAFQCCQYHRGVRASARSVAARRVFHVDCLPQPSCVCHIFPPIAASLQTTTRRGARGIYSGTTRCPDRPAKSADVSRTCGGGARRSVAKREKVLCPFHRSRRLQASQRHTWARDRRCAADCCGGTLAAEHKWSCCKTRRR